MAKPIKETPILYGKESDRFLKAVEENENNTISREEYEKSRQTFSKILKNAQYG